MKFFVSKQANGAPLREVVLPMAALAVAFVASSPALLAQQVVTPAAQPTLLAAINVGPVLDTDKAVSSSATGTLPEAPVPVTSASANDGTLIGPLPAAAYGEAPKNAVAPKYAKYIASNETAQKINAHDKVVIGFRDLYSFENGLAIVFSAGYEQVTNGEPNYGTNSTAFGKRVGAAAIRETSQGIFTDVVFSPLFRDDPRYFAQGDGVGFLHRTFYAITRPLITRTDSGRSTINAPLLLGYAVTSAMTPLYYPQINRNFKDTASNYGGSIGGAAVGFLFSEFSDSLLETLHFKKRP